MKLSIRLQQKGKKNHPLWWIVIAPYRKNIFGRYIQHVGIWSPREGKHLKREVVLNIPRVKYWMAQGAIPTFKVHKFLSMWNILPEQWYYKKSPQQLAKIPQKPQQQLTNKQKMLRARRRKRLERTQLDYQSYHKFASLAMRKKQLQTKILAKQRSQDYQNDIIRQILQKTEFQKYDRIAELSQGNNDYKTPLRKKMKEFNEKIAKTRAQLAFLQKQYKHTHTLQKKNLIKVINETSEALRNLQGSNQYALAPQQQPENHQEYITEEYLQKKIKYEIISKKFQKINQQVKKLQQYDQVITLEEYAYHLKMKLLSQKYGQDPLNYQYDLSQDDDNQNQQGQSSQKKLSKSQKHKQYNQYDDMIYRLAEEYYTERIKGGAPITKFDILQTLDPEFFNIINISPDEVEELLDPDGSIVQSLKDATPRKFMETYFMNNLTYMPTYRPVHPMPDFKNFYPEQHFEPLKQTGPLEQIDCDSLDPYQEVQKYHQKRQNNKIQEIQ